MNTGNYLKIVGLDINAVEATIIDDKNVKNIDEAYEYFVLKNRLQEHSAVWIILPCSYSIEV